MNKPVVGLRVASILFGLMSLAQLARLLMRPEVLVNGYAMPLWPSIAAFLIMGLLSLWMWSLSQSGSGMPQAG